MSLQLKGNSNQAENKPDTDRTPDFKQPDDPSYKSLESASPIHQTVIMSPEASKGKQWVLLIVMLVIVMSAIAVALKFIPKLSEKTVLDDYATASQKTLETDLGLTFHEDNNLLKRLPLVNKTGVTLASSDTGLSIIYKNGKQVGIFITSKSYLIYNVKLNDGEVTVHRQMQYPTDKYWEILNEIGQASTTAYFDDPKTKTCMAVVFNNTSHRAIAIAFFTDLSVPHAGLESLD